MKRSHASVLEFSGSLWWVFMDVFFPHPNRTIRCKLRVPDRIEVFQLETKGLTTSLKKEVHEPNHVTIFKLSAAIVQGERRLSRTNSISSTWQSIKAMDPLLLTPLPSTTNRPVSLLISLMNRLSQLVSPDNTSTATSLLYYAHYDV